MAVDVILVVLDEMKNRLFTNKGDFEEYERCESIREKINFVLGKESLRIRIKEDHFSEKSQASSLKYRNEGNESFKSKNYFLSLNKYTKSIFSCPLTDKYDLSINFANRSAVLFELKLYKECLDDISRSLNNGYPDHLKYKIYLRRGKCENYTHRPDMALASLETGLKYLEQSKLIASRKSEIQSDTKLLRSNVGKGEIRSSENADSSSIQLYGGLNDKFLNASEAMQVQFVPERGRYVIAKKEIPSGSVLFIEKAFVSLLLPDHYESHCFQCCRRCTALIPCIHCNAIGYCSETCRDTSWEKYHLYECRRLDHLNQIGIMHLAMRVVLTPGLDSITAFWNEINEREKEQWFKENHRGSNQDGVYEGGYYSMYHLETHEDDTSREMLFNYILSSCHAIWFLADKLPSLVESQKQLVAYLVYRHSLQLVCNAHAITDVETTDESKNELVRGRNASEVFDVEQRRVGVAVYPCVSLLNHNCKPNVISSFDGDVVIMRASDNIDLNREIVNCYGPHYLRMSRNERQKALLQQYKFVCSCDHCAVEDKNGTAMYDKFDKLAKHYATLGNFEEALFYLKKSVAEVRVFYGENSIELGHELLKISDVMVKVISDGDVSEITSTTFRKNLQELIDTCEEGIEIFRKYYGDNNEHVNDFKEKMKYFEPLLQGSCSNIKN